MNRRIAREAITLVTKTRMARLISHIGCRLRPPIPTVTVFVICTNNREPVELTLRSLRATTRYPKCNLVVIDNASTDGSSEFLRDLSENWGFELVQSEKARAHHEWCDWMFRTASTDYWVHVHDDMFFLASDWLGDMIALLERQPRLYLLGQRTRKILGYREPYGSIIDLDESLVTCLFAVRTSLRDRVTTSFAFWAGERDPVSGRQRCYDEGGRLLADMSAMGLSFLALPWWHLLKWHHFGSLSWGRQFQQTEEYYEFKEYQVRWITGRLKLRKSK